MHETTQGIYEALLHGRFAFDYVHEERLEPERLSKYRALLLPNIAMLSDRQCDQIREYVRPGGSIMASFETGLYDENLKPRAEFGLADLIGISKAGDAIGTNGNAYYGRIERRHARPHPILEGFSNTNWLPGAQNRIPLKPVADPVLTVVPGFVRYPPELAYPPVSHTHEPAVVLRESGASRTAYFPGDIERRIGLPGMAICCGCCTTRSAGSPATRAWSTCMEMDSSKCLHGRRRPGTPFICSITPTPMLTTDGWSRSIRSARRR